METFTQYMKEGNFNLPSLKREIKINCEMGCTTHKASDMGKHAGLKMGYGNGAKPETFKVSRLNSNVFNVEVHNNNQALLDKIELYLKTTGYQLSRKAFNIEVSKG